LLKHLSQIELFEIQRCKRKLFFRRRITWFVVLVSFNYKASRTRKTIVSLSVTMSSHKSDVSGQIRHIILNKKHTQTSKACTP